MRKIALFSLLFFIALTGLQAQTSPGMGGTDHFDMTGFPQWSRDLRRASIIAFGAFPFMYLFTNFAYDSFRLATNDWDMRFAPWPFAAAGRVGHTQSERVRIIWMAAGSAVAISIVDYSIERRRRNRLAREAAALAPGTQIIIRSPLFGEDDADSHPEPEEP